ncbi:MAG TPA: UxaA family hydrolase [Terriglobia bacterium]|nr:UxaA family hydrolase [Terriglobia bacterium]
MSPLRGYQRHEGPPGIRNLVACIHTVECSSFVAEEIAAASPRVHTLGFPGCYSNTYASRMMIALACHPNVGAVLLVSLGCEGTDAGTMAETIRKTGRPVEIVRIQEEGGTERAIRRGKKIVADMLAGLEKTPRLEMSISDLTIGTECGGSDATSGIAANPAVGHAFDMLVDAGATAIIEETLEMVGCAEIVASRGASTQAAEQLRETVRKAEEFSLKADQFSIAAGNHHGGLTTIEEKSMGAFAKCGSAPIRGIIKVAQKPPGHGLYVLDSVPDPSSFLFGYSNPNDSEGILDLISCGAHMVLFTTGRGSVIGSVISPVLKICGNPRTYARMSGDMDVNAGRIVTGEASVVEIGEQIFNAALEVAAGKQTRSEALGHREYCIPYKHQDLCVNA